MASRSAADVTFSGCTSAIGWMPICSLMMNSMRARPTPSLGRIAVRKARSGLPRLTMIGGARPVERRQVDDRRDLERNLPGIDPADLALGARHGDACARAELAAWHSPAPTIAGTPSSRATMAAWQVRPPRLVTMAPARLHHRLPVRARGLRHQHVAGSGRRRGRRVLPMMRTGPLAILSPMARPVTTGSALPLSA